MRHPHIGIFSPMWRGAAATAGQMSPVGTLPLRHAETTTPTKQQTVLKLLANEQAVFTGKLSGSEDE
jgi:hypothetical protein